MSWRDVTRDKEYEVVQFDFDDLENDDTCSIAINLVEHPIEDLSEEIRKIKRIDGTIKDMEKELNKLPSVALPVRIHTKRLNRFKNHDLVLTYGYSSRNCVEGERNLRLKVEFSSMNEKGCWSRMAFPESYLLSELAPYEKFAVSGFLKEFMSTYSKKAKEYFELIPNPMLAKEEFVEAKKRIRLATELEEERVSAEHVKIDLEKCEKKRLPWYRRLHDT